MKKTLLNFYYILLSEGKILNEMYVISKTDIIQIINTLYVICHYIYTYSGII